MTWADLDTGSESTGTYYLYGNCDADATTFTVKISASSSAPTGATYYKQLGSFSNDGLDISSVLDNLTRTTTTTGTIADGSTISIPSGYSEGDCDWTVGLGDGTITGSHPDGVYYTTTVNSSRVVNCDIIAIGAGTDSTCTANYSITCTK
nr:hypothetical protein [Bacteroidota bacterium]